MGKSMWRHRDGRLKPPSVIAIVIAAGAVIGGGVMFANVSSGASPDPRASSYTPRPMPDPDAVVTPEYPRNADGGITAVFLGDSLTYGLFASREEAGYRPQVVAALGSVAPVTATRAGQTGNTVATVSASASIPADAGLVVLALGTNDVWNTPVKDFTAQYEELVQKVRTSAPNATLVCVGVWANPDGARNYDPPISKLCRAAEGRYVKISDLFEQEGTRGPAGVESFGGTSDAFHPNDSGYAAIAQRVKEALGLP